MPNPPKWEIDIADNKPLKRVSYTYQAGVYSPTDTALYYYGALSRVQKIEYHSTVDDVSYLLTKVFTFDRGNLRKVMAVYTRKPDSILYSTEEYFDSYDDKSNPLKSLWLWDALYYRTISSNNFSIYIYKRFDAQKNLTDSVHRSWTLQYDGNANVIFQ